MMWRSRRLEWRSLLMPRFRMLANSKGLAYVEPVIDEEFIVELVEKDKWAEVEAAYLRLLEKFPIPLGQTILKEGQNDHTT